MKGGKTTTTISHRGASAPASMRPAREGRENSLQDAVVEGVPAASMRPAREGRENADRPDWTKVYTGLLQ